MTGLVRWLPVRRLLAVATGTLLGVVLMLAAGLWVVALSPGSAYAQCNCCGQLPSLFSFTTGSTGCGTNPPGNVSPAQCVQGTNNGTACTTDGNCTGGGVCRGHLDCTGLYFGGGQPSGVNLPATIPDRGLSYSKVTSCSGCPATNPVLSPALAADVPAGCSTPAGTPTFGMRHCTSPGCLFGAPLAIPNPANTATGTCVLNVIANRTGVGTGSVTCSTGALNSLTLPLDSQIYLTGGIEPVRTCSICSGGTPGVCGSGTCMGGPRNGLTCTPETSALNGSYPTSHDCPPPGGASSGCSPGSSTSFIGCLPVPFGLTSGTQTKTSFATGAQARVFCGFCFDATLTQAFENPPHSCTADGQCTNGNFRSCRQHSNGAFRNNAATTITETGTSPNVCIGDGLNHAATLVSVFCIPPSYNTIVDPSGEIPGPGAVSLPGTSKFIP